MEQISNDLLYIYLHVVLILLLNLLVDPLYSILVAFLLPNSIAAHQNEVNSLLKLKLIGIRIGRDGLLFWL